MNAFEKFKKPLLLSIGAAALWVIQFLLLPAAFPQFFPQSNEAAFLLLVPAMLASTAGTWGFRIRLTQWLPADGLYILLILLYNGNGLYGIGLRGIRLDGMSPTYSPTLAALMSAGLLAVLILTQSAALGLKAVFRRLKKQ